MHKKLMSRFVGGASFLMLLCMAASAHAVTGSWIFNGSTVNYAGTNQLRIGAGEVDVNNTPAALASSTVNVVNPTGIIWAGPNAAVCPLSTANLMAASTAFYVYYDPTGPQLVASVVAPTEAGIPSGALFFNPGGGCNGGRAAVNYVFLGSFITTTAAAVVPFERFGDQVQFPLLNASGWLPEYTQVFNANAVSTVNLAGLATPWVWPITASAIELEQSISNTDNQVHDLYLIDANWGVATLAANCAAAGAHVPQNYTEKFHLPVGLNVPAQHTWWSPSFSGGTGVTYQICDAAFGANPVNIIMDYRGYREMVHHLDQPR